MMGFKFDKEKITTYINAYIEEHKTKPYIILNSETKKYLPVELSSITFINPSETTWHGAKIMIDEDLKFGEILIR